MGKVAILAVAAFTIYATHHGLGLVQARYDGAVTTAEAEHAAVARQAARAGFARARVALSQSFDDAALGGTVGGADFEVTVDVTGDVAIVRSEGRAAGPRGLVLKEINARIEREAPVLPSLLNYAFLVDDDISLGGSSGVRPEPPTTAAEVRVHTNSDLSLKGSASIAGTATFSGTQTSGSGGSWAPSIPFEPVDAAWLSAAFGVDHDLGPTTWTNRVINGGPADDPLVYRIRGALHMHDVKIHDHVVVIVEGDMIVTGKTVGAMRDRDRFAGFMTGSITMSGNTELYGQFVANHDLVYSGTVDIVGSLAVGGVLSTTGSARIRYRPPSSALAVGMEGAFWGLNLTSYTER